MRIFILGFLTILLSSQATAGLNEAMYDYNSGDMKAAAREFLTLPEKNGFVLYTLGVMFENGQGVASDYSEAVKWYRKAADLISTDKLWRILAQNNLGVLSSEGKGVPQSYDMAGTWYRKAADEGFVESQFNLGMLYARGQGVPADLVQAYKWLSLAAAGGEERAIGVRKTIVKEMTPPQVSEAEIQTRQWLAAHKGD